MDNKNMHETPEELLGKFESLEMGVPFSMAPEQNYTTKVSSNGFVCAYGWDEKGVYYDFSWRLSTIDMLKLMKVLIRYDFRHLDETLEHVEFLDAPDYIIAIKLNNGERFGISYEIMSSYIPRKAIFFDIELYKVIDYEKNRLKHKKCKWKQLRLFE